MNGQDRASAGELGRTEGFEGDRSLVENERRLAALLANLPGMAYRCRNDGDWTIELVSGGCAGLTGYQPADLLENRRLSFNSLIHPEDRGRIWEEVQAALAQRVPYRLTYRIRTADGREKWVLGQGAGVYTGEKLEALEGLIIDVTSGKEAEEKAEAQSKRFRGILESTDAGYFRIGPDGRFQDVNPSWLRMYGFSRAEEVIGLHFSAVQVPESLPHAERIVRTILGGESLSGLEFSRLRRDGTVGYHTFSANPVWEGGKVTGLEGFLVDITERRQAQSERRQIELRYRALFDSMSEGVALHSLVYEGGVPKNYRLLEVNKRYEEILGMKREAVVGRMATEIYATAEPPYLKDYAAVVGTGRGWQFETYFAPMRKHFVVSAAPLGGDQFATIFFDVTGQKVTEQQYRLISEHTADVIWLFDLAEQRCVYVSPSVKKLRGLSPEEVAAQTLEDAMPPDSYRMAMDAVEQRTAAFEAGDETARTGRNDIEFYCKDGSTVATETVTTLVADEQGKVRRVIGVSRDIRPRKRMEDALRKSEEKFAKAFLQGPAITVLSDLSDGDRLIEVNESFTEFLGYRREEVVGKTTVELGIWADGGGQPAILRQLQENGGVRNLEVRFRRKDGQTVTGLTSAEIIELNGKRSLIATTIDITEWKAAEEEKAKLEKQLRQAQKMESVGRLAGGVAHDFNNLLTVINGYSLLLSRELNPLDPRREKIEEIHRAGERAAQLTRQLLAFSRKQDLQPQYLDLNKVLEGMQSLLRMLMGEDVEVRMELQATRADVYADPSQLEQVVMNLAVNARDAMPGGGKVTIRTADARFERSDSQSHAGVAPGGYVWLSVSDEGEGMAEETRQHIFEPFFTTKEPGKGTGLGLSVVQGVVAQSGGHIEVETEAGKGSAFQIYLPVADRPAERQASPQTAPAAGGAETVLVVEDQKAVLTFTARVLSNQGYRVLTAESADAALGLCEREQGRIDLLLTDVVMPGMKGPELARRMREQRPGIRVLFMSGNAGEAMEHAAMAEGEMQVLAKPFHPEGLATKVREVLGQAKGGGRVLVADDDAGVRSFVREVLEAAGYEVTEAADGKQALRQVCEGKAELVITDLIMPEQEGIETIRALRRDVPAVGIIAISGAFGGQFLKTAQILGADAVLSKPLSPVALLRKVAEVLQARR